MLALALGHRSNNDCHFVKRMLVYLAFAHSLVSTWKSADKLLDTAHFANLLLHKKKVVKRQVSARHSLGFRLLDFLSTKLRCGLDDANDIAHAQNALGHSIGMEAFERVGFFTLRDKRDGFAGNLFNG